MAVSHEADPNIIVPAILASIAPVLAAVTGIILLLRGQHKSRQKVEELHAEVRTNHGLRAGDYIEQIGTIVEWAETHTYEDTELRAALGLPPATPPAARLPPGRR